MAGSDYFNRICITGWFVWKEDPETIAALEAEAAD
jgi:hypothetical protein